MQFEQKFIQIPTSGDFWGDNNFAPAQWYSKTVAKRICSQGFQDVKYDGLQSGKPQWTFSTGIGEYSMECRPFFSEWNDNLPNSFPNGIFVNYYKIGGGGEEILQAKDIHIERSSCYEMSVRLIGETALFDGYLNLLVWNPLPFAFPKNPQS